MFNSFLCSLSYNVRVGTGSNNTEILVLRASILSSSALIKYQLLGKIPDNIASQWAPSIKTPSVVELCGKLKYYLLQEMV